MEDTEEANQIKRTALGDVPLSPPASPSPPLPLLRDRPHREQRRSWNAWESGGWTASWAIFVCSSSSSRCASTFASAVSSWACSSAILALNDSSRLGKEKKRGISAKYRHVEHLNMKIEGIRQVKGTAASSQVQLKRQANRGRKNSWL